MLFAACIKLMYRQLGREHRPLFPLMVSGYLENERAMLLRPVEKWINYLASPEGKITSRKTMHRSCAYLKHPIFINCSAF